jgi:hypothetical protein
MKNYSMRIVGSIGVMAIMPIMILSDPALDLKNKSDNAIQVQINDGALKSVAANKSLKIDNLDVSKVYKMYIFYCPTKEYCKKKKPEMLLAEFAAGAKVTGYVVSSAVEYETMYLKFSIKKGKGHLEPQKGSAKETTDGYSLVKNIKEKNIRFQKTAKEGDILYNDYVKQGGK